MNRPGLSDRLSQNLSLGEQAESDTDVEEAVFEQPKVDFIDEEEEETEVVPPQEEDFSSDLEGEEDRSAGGRYFGGTGGPKCFNCGQAGHMVKDCPESTAVTTNVVTVLRKSATTAIESAIFLATVDCPVKDACSKMTSATDAISQDICRKTALYCGADTFLPGIRLDKKWRELQVWFHRIAIIAQTIPISGMNVEIERDQSIQFSITPSSNFSRRQHIIAPMGDLGRNETTDVARSQVIIMLIGEVARNVSISAATSLCIVEMSIQRDRMRKVIIQRAATDDRSITKVHQTAIDDLNHLQARQAATGDPNRMQIHQPAINDLNRTQSHQTPTVKVMDSSVIKARTDLIMTTARRNLLMKGLSVPAWLFFAVAVLATGEEQPADECAGLMEESRYFAAIPVCQKAAGSGKLNDTEQGKVLLHLAEAQEKTGSPWLAVNSLKGVRDKVNDKEAKLTALEKLAKLQLKFGEFQAARETLAKLPEDSDPGRSIGNSIDAAETIYKEIKQNEESSKWRVVEEKCRDMIIDHTSYWKEIFDIRIKALSNLKEWQRAIDAARSKTKVETDSSETDLLIGKLYLSMGNVVLGKKFVFECAKLNSDNKRCMSLRSKIKGFESFLEEAEKKMLLKDAIVALEDALKTIESVPEDEPYYDKNFPVLFSGYKLPMLKLLCMKHARKKNIEEGLKVCEEAKQMDTAHQEFYLMRIAELRLAQEKFDDAIGLLRQALNMKPRDKDIQDMLQKAEKQKLEKMRTKYYDDLGITKDATEETIKKAYNKLVRKWHPDKHPTEEGKKIAQERMHTINAAYDVLNDKKKRRMYDQGMDPNDPNAGHGFQGGPFGHGHGHGGGGGGGFGGMHFNMEDIAEMFRQQQAGRRRGGYRGHDDLVIDFVGCRGNGWLAKAIDIGNKQTSAMSSSRQEPLTPDHSPAHSRNNSLCSNTDDTAYSAGRGRRSRTIMTPLQLRILGRVLEHTAFPSRSAREELGRLLQVDPRTIQIWFQNQRQRARNGVGTRSSPASLPASPTTIFPKMPAQATPILMAVPNQVGLYYTAIPMAQAPMSAAGPSLQSSARTIPQRICFVPHALHYQYAAHMNNQLTPPPSPRVDKIAILRSRQHQQKRGPTGLEH
ncbi:hypothetical protein PSACC_00560 [Paramicrosporidium saccamoebae]|uniref:Uncharacterized protein n=1 Tax=Paramicrosporidium saccamoebae TaxID=1246581 RepID=A0A2H9TPD8_9FUNG|nr:hypothetical protein PSACC_00560 [Paramicrosporidium saccamoebae]